jgi:decaprenyl-phosphate phosphoribosyltransferase
MLLASVRALRPKQWIKNALVFSAPAAAGALSTNLAHVLIGFFGFICASSLGYLINDWVDRTHDAEHPKKKSRPFASRVLGLPHLLTLLFILALGIAWSCWVLPINFIYSMLAYLTITASYSLYIKALPVTEMLWLALGFLIRAVAGSAIIKESPTGWFVVAVFFGSLYVVSAKRISEIRSHHGGGTRKVLGQYTLPFLNIVLTISIAVTLLTYALWVFAVHGSSSIAQMTIVPFTLSVLLYAYHAEGDNAESPEDLVLKDPVLLTSVAFTIIPLMIVFRN